MKKLIGLLLAVACFVAFSASAQVVGTFPFTTTYVASNRTVELGGTAVNVLAKDYQQLAVYLSCAGTNATATGLVTLKMFASPDNSLWTTKGDTNFTLSVYMDGTNRVSVMRLFDMNGVGYFKVGALVNGDPTNGVSSIAAQYISK